MINYNKDNYNKMEVCKLQLLIKEGLDSGISSTNVKDIMQNVENKLRQNGKLLPK